MKISTPVKIALAGVGLGAVFFTVRAINKKGKVKKMKDQVDASGTEAQDILKANLKLPPELQQKVSFSPAQMKSFATKLETAMKGFGTDSEAVANVFKAMNNQLDILLLIQEFGVRDESNLTDWLEGDGETEAVNKILETKTAVAFRF